RTPSLARRRGRGTPVVSRRAAAGAGGAATGPRRAALACLSAARAAADSGTFILAAGADHQPAADRGQPTLRTSKRRHRFLPFACRKTLFQAALNQKAICFKQP